MLESLISKVFSCSYCDTVGLPFVRNTVGKFYRFPPIIGAMGQAPLLFVGINPRVSYSNQVLHDTIVSDPARFEDLAKNRVGDRKYIGTNGLEAHYAVHVKVANKLFPDRTFEAVAAVTELHFCASKSSIGLPYAKSQCAAMYFALVIAIVKPTIVFAVGKHVERTLRAMYQDASADQLQLFRPDGRIRLITLPHPNARGPKNKLIDSVILQAKKHLLCGFDSNE